MLPTVYKINKQSTAINISYHMLFRSLSTRFDMNLYKASLY